MIPKLVFGDKQFLTRASDTVETEVKDLLSNIFSTGGMEMSWIGWLEKMLQQHFCIQGTLVPAEQSVLTTGVR